MPSRAEKKQAFCKWHIFWECSKKDQKKAFLAVQEKSGESDQKMGTVELCEGGSSYTTLSLENARKYDWMSLWVQKTTRLGNDLFKVVPAGSPIPSDEEDEPLHAGASPGLVIKREPCSAETVDSSVEGGCSLAASAGSTVSRPASAVSADSEERKHLSPSLLVLKLAALLQQYDETSEATGDLPLETKLGEGSFAKVHRSKHAGTDVAVKVFDCQFRQDLAQHEAAAAAACPPHENILQLLDVVVGPRGIMLIYPLFSSTLAKWSRPGFRILADVELQHITGSLLHLHADRLLSDASRACVTSPPWWRPDTCPGSRSYVRVESLSAVPISMC